MKASEEEDAKAIRATTPATDSNALRRIQSFMPEEDAAVKIRMPLRSLVNNNHNDI